MYSTSLLSVVVHLVQCVHNYFSHRRDRKQVRMLMPRSCHLSLSRARSSLYNNLRKLSASAQEYPMASIRIPFENPESQIYLLLNELLNCSNLCDQASERLSFLTTPSQQLIRSDRRTPYITYSSFGLGPGFRGMSLLSSAFSISCIKALPPRGLPVRLCFFKSSTSDRASGNHRKSSHPKVSLSSRGRTVTRSSSRPARCSEALDHSACQPYLAKLVPYSTDKVNSYV